MKVSRSLIWLGALWLLNFLLPFPRHQALSNWGQVLLGKSPIVLRESYYDQMRTAGSRPQPVWVDVDGIQVEEKWKPILESHPQDVGMWLNAVTSTAYLSSFSVLSGSSIIRGKDGLDLKTHNYLALTKRFPHSPVVLALHLINATPLGGTRHKGPLRAREGNNPNWSVSTRPQTLPANRKLWDANRQLAIAGEQQEPNNVFWWMVELQCALGANRNKDVFAIIKAGSTKTEYDDHTQDMALKILDAEQSLFGPLSMSEIIQTTAVFYSIQYQAGIRHICIEALENIIGQRLQGNHDVALNGALGLVQMYRTMRLGAKSVLLNYTAEGCEEAVLSGPSLRFILKAAPSNVPAPPPLTLAGRGKGTPGITQSPSPFSAPPAPRAGSSVRVYANDFGSLSYYARLQGHSDIVRRANQEWAELGQFNRTLLLISKRTKFRRENKYMAPAGFTENLGFVMLRGLPLLGILGTTFWLAGRIARLRGFLGAKNIEPSSRLPVFIPVVWSSLCLLVLVLASLFSITTEENPISDVGYATLEAAYWDGIPAWAKGFCGLALLAGALGMATARQRTENGLPSLKERLKNLGAKPEHGLSRFDVAPLINLCSVLGHWTTLAAFLAIYLTTAIADLPNVPDSPTFRVHALLALCVFGALCLAPRVLLWGARKHKRATLIRCSRYARQMFAAHAVIVSVLYLFFCLLGWAAARDTERLTRYEFQKGEFYVLQKQAGL